MNIAHLLVLVLFPASSHGLMLSSVFPARSLLSPFDDTFALRALHLPSMLSPQSTCFNTMQQLEQEADHLMNELIETSGSIIGRNGSDANTHGVAMAKDINENAGAAGTTSAQTTLQLRPSFSVQDNTDTFALTAATPGLRKEDLAVDVIDGADNAAYLVVSGQSSPQKTEASKVAVEDDRTPIKSLTTVYRKFERKIRLPADVDRSLIKASYEDGLLTVTIPKTAKKPSLQLRVPVS